jgi:RHS repeat-associated protein
LIPAELVTYTIYNNMGQAVTKSLSYPIPAFSGSPGSSGSAYVTPDTTQPRTVTRYDGLGRSLGSVTYSSASGIALSATVTYTVERSLPSFNVDIATPFERGTTLDAYNHQTVTYTDALGRQRYSQTFDGTGTATNPYKALKTIQYNFDTVGNTIATNTYDASSNRQAYRTAAYDGLSRVTGWNDSDSGSCSNTPLPTSCGSSSGTAWKTGYDANSNAISATDPRGQTTYTAYDVLNRQLCRGTASTDVSPCKDSATALFFYDSYNNASNSGATFPAGCTAPASGSSPVGHTVAEVFKGLAGSGWRCSGYDTRGQTTQSALSVTADGHTTTQKVSMQYNNGGQLSQLVYPDGESIAIENDDNGLVRSMSNADGSIVNNVQYTPVGQLATLSVGGNLYQGAYTSYVDLAYSYDTIQRPASISASVDGGASLFSQTRTYDNVGNVLQANTTVPTITGGSKTDNQSFCYDTLNRVVWSGNGGTATGGDHCGLNPTGTTTATYQQPFSYDALDRLTTGPSGAMTYDASHAHAAITAGSITGQYASYDAMGNMTCRTVDSAHSCAGSSPTGARLTYDYLGQLESWTAPNGSTASEQYLYDNEGNRVLRRTSTSLGVSDTITFDSYTEITITASVTETCKFYTAVGVRFAMASTVQGWAFLVPDLLGSASVTLNASGGVQAVQIFSPYGSVRYSQGTMPTSYSFTGQRFDNLTGLLYYNARYYDPVVGRFVSADTVQDNRKGFDPYAYVRGNPLTLTDPTGHWGWGAFWGGTIGAVATTVTVGLGFAAIAGTAPVWAPIAFAGVWIREIYGGRVPIWGRLWGEIGPVTIENSLQ